MNIRTFLAAVGVIFLMGTTVGQAQMMKGTTYTEAQRTGKGTLIYTYVTTPGFCEPDAQGNLQGLSVDIMDAFVDWVSVKKGISLTREVRTRGDAASFTNFMAGINGGEGGVFGLGNITITTERQRKYHMSEPILPNVTIMISNNQVPTLQRMEDLPNTFDGFTCYIVTGTTNAAHMRKVAAQYYPGLKFVEVASSEECLERVQSDAKSFTNLDFTYYLAIFKRGLALKRHPVGDESAEQLGVIMPKSNDWAPVFNEFLTSGFLDSPEYRTILAKHLRRDVLELLNAM